MPTYEYICQKCGHVFDEFHGMKENPVMHCPKCKGKTKRQIGTGGGIIFKGSGFYQTDYKKSSAAPSSSSDSSSSEKKSEPKKDSDSKPKPKPVD